VRKATIAFADALDFVDFAAARIRARMSRHAPRPV
jgi:hypothetical protein